MPSRVDYYTNGNGFATESLPARKNSSGFPLQNFAGQHGYASSSTGRQPELLDKFVEAYDELQAYRSVPNSITITVLLRLTSCVQGGQACRRGRTHAEHPRSRGSSSLCCPRRVDGL